MMQLICNGERLDLYRNTDLQFKHENPLFAFDSLSCERTTAFKLPATPTNDNVLGLARIPAYTGEGMRRKFAAQLQAGAVSMDGYLYVGSWNGSEYEAVFVTGELVGLQAIKNLGKISEILTVPNTVTIGDVPRSPNAAMNEIWQNVAYLHPQDTILVPSIGLEMLYNYVISSSHIHAQQFPQSLRGWRIVPAKAKGVDEWQNFASAHNPNAGTQPDGTLPANSYNILTFDSRLFSSQQRTYDVMELNVSKSYNVRVFVARMGLKLTFPDDFPENIYMYSFPPNAYHFNEGDFYGGRYFTTTTNGLLVPHGEPLAGRTVQLVDGDSFGFVDSNDMVDERESVLGQMMYTYGMIPLIADYNYSIRVQSINAELEESEICRLQDNLPDISVVELFKAIAALTGTVLNYDETNGVTFEPLNVASYQRQQVDTKLMKLGEVRRIFADYAQRNTIDFKSNDGLRERVSAAYTVDNENIEEAKVLQTIPFSEGENLDGALFIAAGAEEMTIGANTGGGYLARPSLVLNAGLQALCDASTQIESQFVMSLYEYNRLTPKMKVLLQGTEYMWTSKEWQRNIAKMVLAKV